MGLLLSKKLPKRPLIMFQKCKIIRVKVIIKKELHKIEEIEEVGVKVEVEAEA